jgi:hydroxymethylpyrimidine/phosphomethylpyrimidine kinase
MEKIRKTDRYFLSVAAIDNTGEAGTIKDCKIAAHFGFNTLAAVTAITVQDDKQLLSNNPVCGSILQEQLRISSSYPVSCIKIGALGSVNNAMIVAEALKLFPDAFIVWDPVFAPSRGEPFILPEDSKKVIKVLLPKINIVTPNYEELLTLIDKSSVSFKEKKWEKLLLGNKSPLLSSLQKKSNEYNCSFYLTGGHNPDSKDEITEVLIDSKIIFCMKRKRTPLAYQHGTGCTFSSALACLMILTGDLSKACLKSAEFFDSIYADN